jgi:fibronectin-binding autotransporter adhesin
MVEQLERRDLLSVGAVRPTFILGSGHPAEVPSGSGFTPEQLRTAYGINSITFVNETITGDGSGQTIAIDDAYNDPNIFSDLDSFDQNVYLSAAEQSSGTTLYDEYGAASSFLTVFNQNGNVINPSTETSVPNAPKNGWGIEISLDVEWAHSIAPGARIDLVECASDLYTGAITAAGLSGVSVVSMSWTNANNRGDPAEFSGETADDGDFVHQGVTFLGATGDDGTPGGYPAYSPNVLAVGGTSLSLNANNTWNSEVGWSGSGGGTSLYETEPAYQDNVQTTGFRTIPDVSMDADPSTGVAIYDSYDLGTSTPWTEVGGTSVATPCWAGLIAIANQGREAEGSPLLNTTGPTQTQTFLYGLPSSDFHDDLGGSNGSSSSGLTNPALYNTVTGLGSPVANTLVPDLASAGVISISPTTLPAGQVGTTYSQTITASGGTGSTTLTVSTLPPGLISTASPNQLVISGTPTVGGTFTFTVNAIDSAGHVASRDYSLTIATHVTGPLVVTNTSNVSTVTGSLPWAVAQADDDVSGTAVLIEFAGGSGQAFATAQTISLSGTLDLSNTTTGESITIDGPAAGLTIQGGGSTSSFSAITVAAGTTVTLQGLTASNGWVSSSGGGIDNEGTLTLSNDTISGNSAVAFGGGIYDATGASLTLINSTVADNTVTGTADNEGYGAGLFGWGTMTVSDDTFNNNTASYVGGGIYCAGVTTVSNSTFTANSAEFGGGLGNQNTLAVGNSTISGNAAISGGDGGGLANLGNLILQNSIVSGNTASTDPDLYGSITTDEGYNLLGTALQGETSGTGDKFSNAPDLAALASNGGPTKTMALLAGSPAIGNGVVVTGVTTDQRGESRASPPDIGAYEYNVPVPTVTGVSPATGPAAGGTQVTITGTDLGSADIVMVDFGANNPATIVSDTGTTLVVMDPAGTGTVNITVTTAGGTSATSPADQFRYPGSLTLSPTTLSAATVGTSYSQTVSASGGTAPYTFAVSSGSLPAGLTLSAAGVLSGTATAGGSFHFTVTATDSASNTGSQSYSLTVNPATITISPQTLPAAKAGVQYSDTLTASGGTAPYTFAVSSGSLPAGLSLSATGALTGMTTAGGSFSFTVTATDSSTGTGPYSGSQGYTLVVNLPVTHNWTGGGGDSNWSDPANWGGTAPSPGDALVFGPGASALTSVNNFPSGTEFSSITFSSAGYTITGNSIMLLNGINTSAATGANSFGLNTTLLSGQTWTAGAASTSLTLGGNLNNNGFTLTVGGGTGTIALDGVISGAGGLIDSGTGTLIVAGANTYSGSTTLAAGTLTVGNSGALGSGALTVDGSTTLTASAAGLSLSNAVTAAGSFTLGGSNALTFVGAVTLTGSRTVTVSSGMTGTFAGGVLESPTGQTLTKAGSGTLVLPVADNYSGGTVLNGGTLTVGAAGSLGTGSLTLTSGVLTATGSAVTLSNNVTLAGNVSLGGTVNINFAGVWTLTGNRTVTVTSSGIMTQTGTIGQSGGAYSLTKAGGGTLVLQAANSFSGGTILTAGVLEIGNAGSVGSGTLNLQGGTLEAGSTLSLPNNVTLAGNVSLGGTANITFAGVWTLTGNRTVTVTSSGIMTQTGTIGQSGGAYSLTKAGGGTLVLQAANTFSGGTILSSGLLEIGNAGSVGPGTLNLQGGTLEATGSAITLTSNVLLSHSVTIGGSLGLTITGPMTLAGNCTLTVSNTATTTFQGAIGQSGGAYSLTKYGSGVLVISGSNTYSGGTWLGGGTLALGNTNALGTGTFTLSTGTLTAQASVTVNNPIVFYSNAGLNGSSNMTFTGPVTLTATHTLTVTSTGLTTFSGVISQSGGSFGLTKGGSGTLILSGDNTYTGTTNVLGGTLVVNGNQAGSAVSVGSQATLAGSGNVGAVTVAYGGTVEPGLSSTAAVLSSGNLVFKSGSAFNVVLGGTTPGPGGYSQLAVTGTVNLGNVNLNVSVTYAANIGDSFTIISNDGTDPVVGTFKGLAQGATFGINGMTFQINYQGGNGNDVVLTRVA